MRLHLHLPTCTPEACIRVVQVAELFCCTCILSLLHSGLADPHSLENSAQSAQQLHPIVAQLCLAIHASNLIPQSCKVHDRAPHERSLSEPQRDLLRSACCRLLELPACAVLVCRSIAAAADAGNAAGCARCATAACASALAAATVWWLALAAAARAERFSALCTQLSMTPTCFIMNQII